MNKYPKISIVTVCYNEKNKIENTCRSIIEQDFIDFEWIVIDGGSNDGTLDILKKYKDRMNYFISEKDAGIYNAMNKGLKESKGEWIIFMNGGDCFYEKSVLSSIFSEKYDDDIIFADGVNNVYKTKHPLPINKYGKLELHRFFLNSSLCHQATFINKKLFEKMGGYDESYKIIADHVFNYIAIKNFNAKALYIPKIVALIDIAGVSMENREKLLQENYRLRKEHFNLGVEIKLFLINNLNFKL